MKRILAASLVLLCLFGIAVFAYWFALDASRKPMEVVVSPRAPNDDPCAYPLPKDRELDETEAVAAAECFVIENGYTDLPPSSDPSRIVPENVDPMTDEFGMKLRHNSLQRRAASVTHDDEFWGGSWMVIFRPKHPLRPDSPTSTTFGRVVAMDFYGKDIRILHSPYNIEQPGATLLPAMP